MTLPASGNLSLSQVRAEFGAPGTTALGAFLRGGAWVPNTGANAGVPTALPISLRSLLGASAASAASVQLTGQTVSAGATSPSTATASYSVANTGLVRGQVNADPATTIETWLLSGASSSYDVRATIISGSVSTGTIGAWENLATTRTWTRARTLTGFSSVSLSIELRPAGGGTTLATATINIDATVEA